MSDSSDERASAQDPPESPEASDERDPTDAPASEELTTEELRRQVEEKYDFFRNRIHSA